MADVTVDNATNGDFVVDTIKLGDNSNVQTTHLVVATEGGSAAALAKVEDAAHSSGDPGIMALAVRKDTASALASTDGDYIPLVVDSSGRLHVNVGAALAASRTVDSVAATQTVDRLMNNLTAVTPTFAAISAASSGNNTIVAAQGTSNIILVHQVLLVASGAVTVRFESGADGAALTGQMALPANGGFVIPFSPVGWFKTAANTLLNLELSGATQVSGVVGYTVVT